MNWHEVIVSRDELGLALGAIGLGGGTVTATLPGRDTVAITYVTRDADSMSVRPALSPART